MNDIPWTPWRSAIISSSSEAKRGGEYVLGRPRPALERESRQILNTESDSGQNEIQAGISMANGKPEGAR
jgi:hypothetical protein